MGRLSDKIIFSRLENKDKEAFIRAYDSYVDKVYRFVYFKIGNEDEAKDITSIVFLKTWEHINKNSLKEEKTLKSLIYKIARNAVIDFYRDDRRNKFPANENFSELENTVDLKNDLTTESFRSSDIENLKKKMAELKDEYKEIIILRFIEELSFSEIGKILDKSSGNARVLAYRALKALKELINKPEENNKK